MAERNYNVKGLHVRAEIKRNSYDKEKGTVDVVFVTERPVRSYDWDFGEFMEILSMDPQHIKSERMAQGLPLLNNHKRYEGVFGVLGIAENFRFENKQGVATLRFSNREDVKGVKQDVEDGILKGISVGYNVYRYELVSREEGKLPVLRAIEWEPMEVSLAPIQADVESSVRMSEEKMHSLQVMFEDTLQQIEQIITGESSRSIQPETTTENSNRNMENNEEKPGAATTAPATAPAQVDAEAVRKDAAKAERQRQADIRAAVRKAGLDESFADELANDDSMTIDAARAAIIDKWAEKDPAKGQRSHGASVAVGADESDKFRKAASDSIILRANPNSKLVDDKGKDVAREFRGMNMLRLAEESLIRAGVNTRGMSKREIAMVALTGGDGMRSYHTSSDFPILLTDTINRTLRAAYAERPRTFEPFVRRTTLPDFREISRAQLSNMVGNFDEIAEGGEYTAGTLTTAQEKYRLVKYGKKIAITWESIINDDLSAFDRLPQAIASKAAQKQSDIVYGILLNNPTMGDNLPLFQVANHKNALASGTAIGIDSLGVARAAVRDQVGLEGNILNLEPRFLIVGSAGEQAALQFTSSNYVPDVPGNINVWAGRLQPIIEPRISGGKWFLACDPGQIDTIETAFLDGEQELYTEQKVGFDVDGLEVKARMVFAAKAIDHRGFFYNPGNGGSL